VDGVTLLAGAIVVLGFAGIFLPALPGLLLILAGIAVWAIPQQHQLAWLTLGGCAVLAVVGLVLQYVIPGRRLANQAVPAVTLIAGATAGFVGFFAIPVAGVLAGFVAGVWLAEFTRLGSADLAWPSTKRALAAVGWSILIEFTAGLLMLSTWVGVMLFAS
jgi:uncharacterized protein